MLPRSSQNPFIQAWKGGFSENLEFQNMLNCDKKLYFNKHNPSNDDEQIISDLDIQKNEHPRKVKG